MLQSIPFYASLLDKQLTEKVTASHRHVLLYGAIEVHSMGNLGCIAGNETLAKETGLAPEKIRLYVSEMKKGGWIDYTISKDSKRSEITPLLEIKIPDRGCAKKEQGVCQNSTGGVLKRNRGCAKKEHIEYIIGNNIDNSIELKETEFPEEKPTINKTLELFKVVDLNYSRHYSNTTERKALEQLLKTHGLDKITEVLNKAVIYNKFPYITSYDKIYKPTELLRNWQKLHDKEDEIVLKQKITEKESRDKAVNRVVWA